MFNLIPQLISLLKSNTTLLSTLADGNTSLSPLAQKAIEDTKAANAEAQAHLTAAFQQEGGLVEW